MIKERTHAGNSSLEDIDGMQIGSMMLTDAAKQGLGAGNLHHSTSFGRIAAARFGLSKSMNVKCKNMKSYDLAVAVDRTQLADGFPMVVL